MKRDAMRRDVRKSAKLADVCYDIRGPVMERARPDPVHADRAAGAARDLLAVARKDVEDALADGTEAEEPDVQRTHAVASRRPATGRRRGTSA